VILELRQEESGGASMPARKPQELHEMWESALNSADAEGLLQLYEEKAVFIAQPGQRCEDLDQIRAAIEAWIPLKPRIALRATHLVECGDLALSQSEWTLKATNPEGEPLQMEGNGTEVLRRQADGSWRFLIDDPFGAV
jgi:uncharacterized protein (TIGR02246 family)